MSTVSIHYTPSALNDLRQRTEYEAWLLEAVYEIVDQHLSARSPDAFIYPPNGDPPDHVVYGAGKIKLGDWHPGFLEAAIPLVFVTTFKLLDMLLEWVLAQNGKPSTYRFVQKIGELKGPVVFPQLIETRTWLRERLIALYEQLEPLRGTIIHDRHFKTTGGTLEVASSKHGTVGPVVRITQIDLRNLALVLVSLLRYLEGTWTMDPFQEKRVRHALDQLVHLHRSPSLGQLSPEFLTVRVYVPDEDPIEIDLGKIRSDIAAKRPGYDVLFDVRIIAVARDGRAAKAYIIGWDQLQNTGLRLQKTRTELATSTVPLPPDIDPAAAARDLNLLHFGSATEPQAGPSANAAH